MAGRVLSMEIGQGMTRVIEIDYMAKAPKIYNAFSLETPKDMVQDGVITRNEDFIIALKGEMRKREIKTDTVVFTVSSTRIANREARIPLCKPNKILPLITANAADYFPVDMNQYHLVYNILGKTETAEEKQYRLSLLAVPNDVTTSYLDLAHSLGLHIKALDYVGNSIYNVVREDYSRGTNAIIKIDEHSSLVTIVKAGEIVLQRSVAHGVNGAIENMMDLDLYGEAMDYNTAMRAFMENHCLRRYLNVDVDYQEPEDTSDEMMMSRIMLTENLRYLIGNIGRILEYYVSRNENDNIESVAIVGVGADFMGMDELLSNELGYDVRPYDGLAGIRITSAHYTGDVTMHTMAACVGAAMKPLQLLSPELLKGEKQTSLVIPFAVMIAGIVVAVALFMVGEIMVSAQQNKKRDIQADLDKNKSIQEIKMNFEQTRATYDEVIKFQDVPVNNNSQLGMVIQEMERKMPKKFKALSVSATNAGVTIAAECTSKEEAATIINNLREFKTLVVIATSEIVETYVDLNTLIVDEEDPNFMTEEEREEAIANGTYVPNLQTTVSFTLQCTYANVHETTTEAQ